MRITFHGAARSVTGTRHLIESGGRKILLDCGLVQGRREESDRRNREYGFDPATVDALILSHAHIDHAGAVPALIKNGFRGGVHSTLATADLSSFMLRDSAHLQEKDAEYANKRMARRRNNQPEREPLYTVAEAEKAMEHFSGHPYYRPFQVVPGISATFHDAGHILGSAIVEVQIEEDGARRSIVFSGDLGRRHIPIIRDPDRLAVKDVLIMESTYGDRDHAPVGDASVRLAGIVNAVVARGGKLIIPAFAVGRTQDMVYELVQLADEGKIPDCPIYVDSPLAVDATSVFHRHPECYDAETRLLLRQERDPFGLHRMRYLRTKEESMALNQRPGPCLIISASGMMEGGRILHHLRNSLGDPHNAILIVGFQAENTLGRRILRGDPEVNIFGEPHQVKAEVFVMNEYSAHADRTELFDWFRGNDGPAQDVFVVHGEEEQALAFASRLEQGTTARVHVPALHQTFGLGGRDGRQEGPVPDPSDQPLPDHRSPPNHRSQPKQKPRRRPRDRK
jgi:metallo-beta-lactamase family protein